MQFNLDISSFNVNATNKENSNFKKYEIDVSLNEVSNNENSCLLKYGYTLSSLPKGIRLTLEGTIEINGDSSEIESAYKKDEQNIPPILRMSYHELYPVLFMITKSMRIPCPPYEISKTMDLSEQQEEEKSDSSISSEKTENLSQEIRDEQKQEDEKLEAMSTEELTQLQIDLSKQNSENPSDELQNKLDTINEVLNKKIKNSTISPKNVS